MGSHLLCCDGAHVGDAADPSLLLFIDSRQELKGQGSQSSTRNYCWLTASAEKRVITLSIHTERDLGWRPRHLQFSITFLMNYFLFESIICYFISLFDIISHMACGCSTPSIFRVKRMAKRGEREFRASVLPNHSPLDWTLLKENIKALQVLISALCSQIHLFTLREHRLPCSTLHCTLRLKTTGEEWKQYQHQPLDGSNKHSHVIK